MRQLMCKTIHQYAQECCPWKDFRLPKAKICVAEGVYPPKLDTLLLAEELLNVVKAGDRVLDVGSGAGTLAVLASIKGAHSVATEIHEASANCIRHNSILNSVKVEVRIGYLFKPVRRDERFDIVVCNPPSLPTPPSQKSNRYTARAIDGGREGRKYLDVLFAQVGAYLNETGYFLTVHSNFANIEKTVNDLQHLGFLVTVTENEFPIGKTSGQRVEYFLRSLPPNCHPFKKGANWFQRIAVFKARYQGR